MSSTVPRVLSIIPLPLVDIISYSASLIDIVTEYTIDKCGILWYTPITELRGVSILKKEVDNTMTMTIYKYPLPLDDRSHIQMPRGAHVLCVQVQRDIPYLWAIVDPDQPLDAKLFRLCGTGHPLEITSPESRYIGTFQLAEGSFIGHVFELKGG